MMQAGKYYIGDLCYVLRDEWSEFCTLTIDEGGCLDGEFQMEDGREFAVYKTMYGDGVYHPNIGGRCGVDAGLIGCIRVDDIIDGDLEDGVIVEFDQPFETGEEDGVIFFGHVTVDTTGQDDEEYEYDDEPDVDEAQEWHDFDPDC